MRLWIWMRMSCWERMRTRRCRLVERASERHLWVAFMSGVGGVDRTACSGILVFCNDFILRAQGNANTVHFYS